MREHIMKRLWSADVSAAKPGVQAHMRQSIVIGLGLALIFACVPLAGLAQESSAAPKGAEQPKSADTYKLEFSVHELEAGKRVNARSYTMMVQERSRGSVQVGSRVPIATGQGAQFQYQSVGMTIECRPIGRDGSVSLDLHVDVEGLLKPEEAGLSAAERNPVFRTNIFRSEAVIPLGKPTVVGAMDDVASNRRYEIEVTATKVR